MPIEFRCTGCAQTLRVSDDSAGKQARCPRCGTLASIPMPDVVFPDPSTPERAAPERVVPKPSPGEFGDRYPREASPYSGPQSSPFGPAGVHSVAQGNITNVPVDFTTVWDYSVSIWKEHLGMLVAAMLVVIGISSGLSYGTHIVVAIAGQVGPEAALVFQSAGSLVCWIIQVFLGIGFTQMMFKMARRQQYDFAELFAGGPVFLPALGVSVLFMLALFCGFLALVIPAIFFGLMWWPCYYLVVDRQTTVFSSFSAARIISDNNWGTVFVVWIVGCGLALLGFLACCVGVVIMAPLAGMMHIVSYLMMSGQLPIQAKQEPYRPYA